MGVLVFRRSGLGVFIENLDLFSFFQFRVLESAAPSAIFFDFWSIKGRVVKLLPLEFPVVFIVHIVSAGSNYNSGGESFFLTRSLLAFKYVGKFLA